LSPIRNRPTLKPSASRAATRANTGKGAQKANKASPAAAAAATDGSEGADAFSSGGGADPASSGLFAQAASQGPGRAMGPLAARMQGAQMLGQTALANFAQQMGGVAFANIMSTMQKPDVLKQAHRQYYEAIRTRLLYLAKLMRSVPALRTPENQAQLQDLLEEMEALEVDEEERDEMAAKIPVEEERAQAAVSAVWGGRQEELRDCCRDVMMEFEEA